MEGFSFTGRGGGTPKEKTGMKINELIMKLSFNSYH